MRTLLIILMLVSGISFIVSVLLMSPKGGGLGMGIGGASGGANEYGSKKTIEGKLKKIALITISIFVLTVLFLPFDK